MMKKAIGLLTALFAFAFGVFVFHIRPLVVPVSLSELRGNTSQFKLFKLRVIGKLEVSEAESVYFVNLKDWEGRCSGELHCFNILEVSDEIKAENIALLKETAEKNKTIGKTDFRHGEYLADVEITGHLIEVEDKFFGGVSKRIKVEKIKQLSPIRFVFVDDMK